MNVKNLILEFENKLQSLQYSASSVENYKSALGLFLKMAGRKYNDHRLITAEDVEKYIGWLIRKKKISHSYQRLTITSIIKFFDMILNIKLPVNHLYPKRIVKRLPSHVSKEEMVKMLKSTVNLKHRCIIALLYSSGIRLRELLNLQLHDVDSKSNTINIRSEKGTRNRKTILSDKILDELRSYYKAYKPEKYLFEGQNGGPYSKRSVQEIVREAATRAGIKKKVTPHTLRHSFATHLVEAGTDIHFIQELLGHQSVKTTEIYTHLADTSRSKVKSPIDSISF